MGSYDPAYDFLLDGVKSLTEAIPIIGNTGYTNINLEANPPYTITANNSAPAAPRFKNLTDSKTSYTIQLTDETIEVSSLTYTDIYLPTAAGIGGYVFYVLNNSTQNVYLRPAGSDHIENANFLKLSHEQHSHVISNNYDTWHTF